MDDPRFDAELEERFRRLREEDAARTPAFDALFAEARRRAGAEGDAVSFRAPRADRARRWAVGALLAAAAVAAVWLAGPDPDGDFDRVVTEWAAATGGSEWRSPTDALLDVPGRELMGTVPTIGGGALPAPVEWNDDYEGRNDA